MDKPPYKTADNVWLTATLFQDIIRARSWEQRSAHHKPVFSLHSDYPGLINCQKTFVQLGDPTGYKWAILYLDSWPHFQKLLKAPWFKRAFDIWNEELTMKRKSEALDVIRGIAMEEGNKSALPAARYLVEYDRKQNTKGRPTKADMDAELKRQVGVIEQEDEDMVRMGLKVVGGKNSGNAS